MKALELIRIGFDNFENRDGEFRESHGIFVDDEGKTAFTKVKEKLKSMGPEVHYPGWDNQVYPQYKIVVREIK